MNDFLITCFFATMLLASYEFALYRSRKVGGLNRPAVVSDLFSFYTEDPLSLSILLFFTILTLIPVLYISNILLPLLMIPVFTLYIKPLLISVYEKAKRIISALDKLDKLE